jgi:hypothetical protein
MAHQITHPTGKPEGLSLAVLRLDAEPVAYLTPQTTLLVLAMTSRESRQLHVFAPWQIASRAKRSRSSTRSYRHA